MKGFAKAVGLGLRALLFPQCCLLCRAWVVNPSLSPLCRSCLESLPGYPARVCVQCGIVMPGNILEPAGWCVRCRREPPPYDLLRAWGPYRGGLKQLIHQFKFNRYRRLARPLSGLLAAAFETTQPGIVADLVAYVPCHRHRIRQRGYDQARLLAGELAQRLRLPLLRTLRRVRATRPQFGLSRQERWDNLRGAFRLDRPDEVAGRRVILVDDILTSGTTICEACGVFREAGAKQLLVLVVARAELAGNPYGSLYLSSTMVDSALT